jgi:hypothetical protein
MNKLIFTGFLLIASPIALSDQINEMCEEAAEYAYRGYDDAHYGITFADRVVTVKNKFPNFKYQKLMVASMKYGRSLYPLRPTLERHEVLIEAKAVCLEGAYK